MAIQQNTAAKNALIAGIASYVLYFFGCVIPIFGMLAFISAFAAIYFGWAGMQFAKANDGDGNVESMIGLALGAVALLMWVALIAMAFLAGGLLFLSNM